MTKKFPKILNNRLWHTTSTDRFENIVKTGLILREPPLDDSERHTSKDGPQYNPLVRQLRGISLFNFVDFDPVSYEKKYQSSTWYSFVPCYHRYSECVWIEINKDKILDNLILADGLKEISDRENNCGNRMPEIEVACMVDIKKEWFLDVLLYEDRCADFIQYQY